VSDAKIEFTQEAVREMDDVFESYLEGSFLAAEAFLREVDSAVALIASSPPPLAPLPRPPHTFSYDIGVQQGLPEVLAAKGKLDDYVEIYIFEQILFAGRVQVLTEGRNVITQGPLDAVRREQHRARVVLNGPPLQAERDPGSDVSLDRHQHAQPGGDEAAHHAPGRERLGRRRRDGEEVSAKASKPGDGYEVPKVVVGETRSTDRAPGNEGAASLSAHVNPSIVIPTHGSRPEPANHRHEPARAQTA
jgi:hypothetical protein